MFQHFVDTVGEFHRAYLIKPKSLCHNLELRIKLLWEEYNELKEAKSPEDELDAITDMVYIASGTLEQYDQLAVHGDIVEPQPRSTDTDMQAIDQIMRDIEFTPNYFNFLKFHVELLFALQRLAKWRNYDLMGAFNEVHSSNMSKLDDNGKPVLRHDGKVLKGPNFRPPRLEKFTVMEPINVE